MLPLFSAAIGGFSLGAGVTARSAWSIGIGLAIELFALAAYAIPPHLGSGLPGVMQ